MPRIHVVAPLLLASASAAFGQWSTETLSLARDAIAAAAHGRYAVFAGGSDPAPTDVIDVYDARAGAWSVATASHALAGARAVVAGNEILIAGGSSDPRVEVLDTLTGLWSTKRLSLGRTGLGAAAVGSKALFAGGAGTDVVDVYDARTSAWSTASLSQARANVRAVTVGSRVLFAGGTGPLSDVVDIYDDETGSWAASTLSQPSAPLVAAVGPHAVFAHSGGSVDVYDSVNDAWSTTALPSPRVAFGVGAVAGKVFFAGGDDGLNNTDVVDVLEVATGAWSVAVLSEARWSPTPVRAGSKLLFVGGDLGGSDPVGSDAVDVYDAYTDTWTSTTLSQGRLSVAAAVLGGRAFLAGGTRFCSTSVGTCFYSDRVDVFTDVGAPFCAAPVANSLGVPARIAGSGSALVSDDDFGLIVTDLPPNRFGYVLASRTQGFAMGPGGSQGNLCLSGLIARYTQQAQNSGASGILAVQVDLASIPLTPPQAVVAGDTWSFQCWYRDVNPSPTSNFSDGWAVTFE